MYTQKVKSRKAFWKKVLYLLASWRSITDPDPQPNVMDPEHWLSWCLSNSFICLALELFIHYFFLYTNFLDDPGPRANVSVLYSCAHGPNNCWSMAALNFSAALWVSSMTSHTNHIAAPWLAVKNSVLQYCVPNAGNETEIFKSRRNIRIFGPFPLCPILYLQCQRYMF